MNEPAPQTTTNPTDPIATIDPSATTDPTGPAAPAATTSPSDPVGVADPAVTAPVDPITGTGGSNTSNGNQVAVLSTIDYSTNNIVYNYNLTSSSEQQSSTTNNYSMTGSSSQTVSSLAGNSSTSDSITGNPGSSSLQRSGYLLRFDSGAYFRTNGLRRVDRIMGFNGSNGDKLQLSRRHFKGIGKMEFESVANNKQVKRAAKSDADIIYNESSGKLYFNANLDDKGFGAKGGLFAILESTPMLSADQFMLI